MVKIEDNVMAFNLGLLHAGGFVKGSAKNLGIPSHLLKDFESGKSQRPKAPKKQLNYLALRYEIISNITEEFDITPRAPATDLGVIYNLT